MARGVAQDNRAGTPTCGCGWCSAPTWDERMDIVQEEEPKPVMLYTNVTCCPRFRLPSVFEERPSKSSLKSEGDEQTATAAITNTSRLVTHTRRPSFVTDLSERGECTTNPLPWIIMVFMSHFAVLFEEARSVRFRPFICGCFHLHPDEFHFFPTILPQNTPNNRTCFEICVCSFTHCSRNRR